MCPIVPEVEAEVVSHTLPYICQMHFIHKMAEWQVLEITGEHYQIIELVY